MSSVFNYSLVLCHARWRRQHHGAVCSASHYGLSVCYTEWAADVDLGIWDAGDLKDGPNLSEVLKIRVLLRGFR